MSRPLPSRKKTKTEETFQCLRLHTSRKKFLPRFYFLRNEQPSVSRALPPVGWQSTVVQPWQMTTVWAWEKTVVMVKQPGHFTSMKKDRGAGTRAWCLRVSESDHNPPKKSKAFTSQESGIIFPGLDRTLSLCLRVSAEGEGFRRSIARTWGRSRSAKVPYQCPSNLSSSTIASVINRGSQIQSATFLLFTSSPLFTFAATNNFLLDCPIITKHDLPMCLPIVNGSPSNNLPFCQCFTIESKLRNDRCWKKDCRLEVLIACCLADCARSERVRSREKAE